MKANLKNIISVKFTFEFKTYINERYSEKYCL